MFRSTYLYCIIGHNLIKKKSKQLDCLNASFVYEERSILNIYVFFCAKYSKTSQ